jgi:hypothetical protein
MKNKNNEQLKKIKIDGKESLEELKEIYFSFKRDLLELGLNACKEVVANYSFRKKILKRNIAYLNMMIFKASEKELVVMIQSRIDGLKEKYNLEKMKSGFDKNSTNNLNENINEFSKEKE